MRRGIRSKKKKLLLHNVMKVDVVGMYELSLALIK